jgi:hypothetical protein
VSILDDPRVRRDLDIYWVDSAGGVWGVVADDGEEYVAVPPPGSLRSFRGDPTSRVAYAAWFAALLRFGTAEEAVASILDRQAGGEGA